MRRTSSMRKEYETGSRNFLTVRDSFNRLQAAIKDPSPAGDIAAVLNYMKMLDPSSVVRESKYATAANAAGVRDRMRNLYNKILSGKTLTPAQRADFTKQAQFVSQWKSHIDFTKEHRRIAAASGIDPDLVIIDYTIWADSDHGMEPQRQ